MKNPTEIWLKELNLYSIEYKDFPIEDQEDYIFYSKIHGQLDCLVYKRNKDCYFLTKNDIEKRNLLVLNEYKQTIDKIKNINEIIIMGESVGYKNGKILPFNQTQSIVKTAYKNKEFDELYNHFPFDIFSVDGKRTSNFKDSLHLINRIFKNSKRIHPIMYTQGNLSLAWKTFSDLPGIEGLVARSSKRNYKIKKSFTFDMVIVSVGAEEMISWVRDEVGYVRVAFMDKEKNFIVSSKVGTGLSRQLRSKLFNWALKHEIERKGKEIWVKPELVIEVEWGDIYIRDISKYEYKNNTYQKIGVQKACTLINPRFIRFREDKKVNEHDLRLEQIPGLDLK